MELSKVAFKKILRQLRMDRYGPSIALGGIGAAASGLFAAGEANAQKRRLEKMRFSNPNLSESDKQKLDKKIQGISPLKTGLIGAGIGGAAIGGLSALGTRMILKSIGNELRVMRRQTRAANKAWEDARQRSNEAWEEYLRGARNSRSSGSSGGSWGGGFSSNGSNVEEAKKFLNMGGVKTKAEAKKLFREAAKKNHPDMGGSEEMMKKVNDHWDTIQNSEFFDKLAFLKGFEKKAFGSIDPLSAGAFGGVISGYHSGRSAAGTVSNMVSSKGSKTKNEELARTLAKGTAPLGALIGLAAGLKHKNKLLELARNNISKEPGMAHLYEAILPFMAATAGGVLAGGGTGALTSLRGKFSKEKK